MSDTGTGLWASCPDASAIEMALMSVHMAHTRVDAQAFLHGNCDVFALALHEAYGYPVEIAAEDGWDEDCPRPIDALVHAYCRDGPDYVDVRGRTSDRHEFFRPFEGPVETGFGQPSAGEIKAESLRLLGGDGFGLWHADAVDMIRAHPEWYEPAREQS